MAATHPGPDFETRLDTRVIQVTATAGDNPTEIPEVPSCVTTASTPYAEALQGEPMPLTSPQQVALSNALAQRLQITARRTRAGRRGDLSEGHTPRNRREKRAAAKSYKKLVTQAVADVARREKQHKAAEARRTETAVDAAVEALSQGTIVLDETQPASVADPFVAATQGEVDE